MIRYREFFNVLEGIPLHENENVGSGRQCSGKPLHFSIHGLSACFRFGQRMVSIVWNHGPCDEPSCAAWLFNSLPRKYDLPDFSFMEYNFFWTWFSLPRSLYGRHPSEMWYFISADGLWLKEKHGACFSRIHNILEEPYPGTSFQISPLIAAKSGLAFLLVRT